MHLLQVCNVGNICGGTAACARSITRALPNGRHSVVFLSRPTTETTAAFTSAQVEHWPRVTDTRVQRLDPDVVLLHNTTPEYCAPLAVPLTIQYLHSRVRPADAQVTVSCSHWLRKQYALHRVDGVLYQPVDVPADYGLRESPRSNHRFVVGRLCTPTSRKWPPELPLFYAELAARHPQIDWEFVGCPGELAPALSQACRGRATFLPAESSARRHLLRWDALLYHHPSLPETFGRTVAEAMLAGCVPLVDDCGGFREQIVPGAGFLCSERDDFSDALAQLSRSAVHTTISQAARLHAQQQFSSTAFARRFQRMLRAVSENWPD